MRVALLLMVALGSSAAPLAAAQIESCVGPVCDTSEGDDCSAAGQNGQGLTLVTTPAGVLAFEESCYGNGATRDARVETAAARVRWHDESSTSGFRAGRIDASAGPAHAEWRASPGACTIAIAAAGIARTQPCPAGGPPAQPDAPWGRLLP